MRTVNHKRAHKSYQFHFSSLFSALPLRFGTRSIILFLAFPIRDLMSLLQLPASAYSEPRYLKSSTTSSCSSSTVTPASDCIFQLSEMLSFSHFISVVLLFLGFPISHSAFSYDSAKCTTVASVPSNDIWLVNAKRSQ